MDQTWSLLETGAGGPALVFLGFRGQEGFGRVSEGFPWAFPGFRGEGRLDTEPAGGCRTRTKPGRNPDGGS